MQITYSVPPDAFYLTLTLFCDGIFAAGGDSSREKKSSHESREKGKEKTKHKEAKTEENEGKRDAKEKGKLCPSAYVADM